MAKAEPVGKIREVEIREEFVELFKILKFEGLVMTGGEAKNVIAEGLVRVNGEMEIRKSKKIVAGDIIEFHREKMRIVAPSKKASEKKVPAKSHFKMNPSKKDK